MKVGAHAKGEYVTCTNPWPHQPHEWYDTQCRGERWALYDRDLYAVQILQSILWDAHWEMLATESTDHVWFVQGKHEALLAALQLYAKAENRQRETDKVIAEWVSRPVGTSSAGETDPPSAGSTPGTDS